LAHRGERGKGKTAKGEPEDWPLPGGEKPARGKGGSRGKVTRSADLLVLDRAFRWSNRSRADLGLHGGATAGVGFRGGTCWEKRVMETRLTFIDRIGILTAHVRNRGSKKGER